MHTSTNTAEYTVAAATTEQSVTVLQVARSFLERFVRQNVAEIDEIRWEEHQITVVLPPAERAIYLEMETHLRALEMNKKLATKSKKASTSDREQRIREVTHSTPHEVDTAVLNVMCTDCRVTCKWHFVCVLAVTLALNTTHAPAELAATYMACTANGAQSAHELVQRLTQHGGWAGAGGFSRSRGSSVEAMCALQHEHHGQ